MRRPIGSGSIEQRGQRFRFVVRLDGQKRHSGLYKDREECEAVLAELLALHDSGELHAVSAMTLRAWGARWLKRRNNRAWRDDFCRWQRHIDRDPIADLPLQELQRRHVKDWLSRLQRRRALEQRGGGKRAPSGRPLSSQTVRHCLTLLRRALGDAHDEGHIAANPAAGLRLQGAPVTADTWTFLTEAEIQQVLSCPELPEEARVVYTVAIYAGLREGELIGLHRDDVLLGDQPHLVVRHSHGGPTKNKKVRRVPLLLPARAALKRWLDIAPNEPVDEGLVFPAPRGGRRGKGDDFGWADKRRRDAPLQLGHKTIAGITRPVRFHDLRHTCASHLVLGTWGQTWRLDEVRDYLGHSGVAVTERYAHLSPDHLHRRAALTTGVRDCPQAVPACAVAHAETASVGSEGLEPSANGLKGRCSTG